jgi:hypothetical protein
MPHYKLLFQQHKSTKPQDSTSTEFTFTKSLESIGVTSYANGILKLQPIEQMLP